jgi:hypothetical protein
VGGEQHAFTSGLCSAARRPTSHHPCPACAAPSHAAPHPCPARRQLSTREAGTCPRGRSCPRGRRPRFRAARGEPPPCPTARGRGARAHHAVVDFVVTQGDVVLVDGVPGKRGRPPWSALQVITALAPHASQRPTMGWAARRGWVEGWVEGGGVMPARAAAPPGGWPPLWRSARAPAAGCHLARTSERESERERVKAPPPPRGRTTSVS